MSKLNNRETNIKWVFFLCGSTASFLYEFREALSWRNKNVISYVNNLSFMVIHTLSKWHAVFLRDKFFLCAIIMWSNASIKAAKLTDKNIFPANICPLKSLFALLSWVISTENINILITDKQKHLKWHKLWYFSSSFFMTSI